MAGAEIHIEVQGLDGMIDSLKSLTRPPTFKTTGKLEVALAKSFVHTQAQVHVLSGRLKASGFTETDFKGYVWSGSVNYGGRAGTPAHYAIYEMNRGGVKPSTGTPHDFFSGLDAYDHLYTEAIDSYFEALF